MSLEQKKVPALALIVLLTYFLTACGGGSSALIGKWVAKNDPNARVPFYYTDLEFEENGIAWIEGLSGHWRTEDGYLMTRNGNNKYEFKFRYKISGSTLILNAWDEDRNRFSGEVSYKRDKSKK
jgi:hypothetical protein